MHTRTLWTHTNMQTLHIQEAQYSWNYLTTIEWERICPSEHQHIKGKAIPVQAWFQKAEAPRFEDNWHIKVVKLSALYMVTFTPRPTETFLVLIFVGDWVDPRATAQPEGLGQRKLPVAPLVNEPMTFQLVVQCLNQLRYQMPSNTTYNA